jgi:hypothetical protein
MTEYNPRNTSPGDNTTAAEYRWLKQNLPNFWSVATGGFEEEGRGILFVDTLVEIGDGYPYVYVSYAKHGEEEHTLLANLVQTYDPQGEFIVVLLKPDQQTSLYHVRVQLHHAGGPQFSLS